MHTRDRSSLPKLPDSIILDYCVSFQCTTQQQQTTYLDPDLLKSFRLCVNNSNYREKDGDTIIFWPLKSIPGSRDPGITIVDPTEISVVYSYVT